MRSGDRPQGIYRWSVVFCDELAQLSRGYFFRTRRLALSRTCSLIAAPSTHPLQRNRRRDGLLIYVIEVEILVYHR